MPTLLTPASTLPRRRAHAPLAWVALAALAGIALAEIARRLLPDADDGRLGFIADGCFLALAVAFLARPAPGWFWACMVAGYAALHFFNADPLPAAVLAHELTTRPAVIARATGTVLDVPKTSAAAADPRDAPGAPFAPGGTSRHFLLRLASLELDGRPRWESHADVMVDWRDGPAALGAGDRLELTALAANVAPPRNPGEFDLAKFLRRRGVRSELFVQGLADGRVTKPGGPFQPLTLAWGVHDWMQDALCRDLRDEPEVCAVVSTMLLGLRDHPGLGLLEPMFQRTGTLHYFAIDGLKLGLLAFLLLRALSAFGLPRPWTGLVILPLLLGYAMATGLGAASARAVLVAAVLVGGEWLDRPTRPFNSLGAAAAILLLFDTNQLFELGFQLSFAVVLSILTLAAPLDRWLRQHCGPLDRVPDADELPWPRRVLDFVRRQACALTAVAVAAWLGSLPLMLLDFHLVSPVSPVANVVAFPLAFAVLALGVFSLAGAAFSRLWVVWMNNANWLVAKALLVVVRGFDAVPGGSVAVSAPEHWRWWEPPPTLEIVVLDLGRARSAYVRAGGADWLVDCARSFDYFERVRPCLQARAVGRLDGLLLTQDDADHLAATPLCQEDFTPACVVLPATIPRSPAGRDLRRRLADGRVPVTFERRGDTVPLTAGVEARVLYPPDGVGGRGTAADRALVLRFEAAGWRVLWMADGGGLAAPWLLAHEDAAALDCDVLVTGAPVTAEWLRAVQPRLVVLRPASGRREKTAESATLPSSRAFVQEESGAVTLEVYPDRIESRGFVDGKGITIRKHLPTPFRSPDF